MGHDKFGRVLMAGDKVRIVLRARRFKPSLKLYTVEGVQPSAFGFCPMYLLNNGKHYFNHQLIREENVSCS